MFKLLNQRLESGFCGGIAEQRLPQKGVVLFTDADMFQHAPSMEDVHTHLLVDTCFTNKAPTVKQQE